MKTPVAIRWMFPLVCGLLFISIYLGHDFVFWLFIPIFLIFILMEIKLKYGSISLKNIIQFSNTPIKQKGILGEEVIDNSPKVSMSKGILIILGGTVVVVILLFFVFSFIRQ